MQITVPCPPWVTTNWHYSGTFFWFNTEKLFSIAGWDNFEKGRFSVESYPGKMVDVSNSHVTLCSENYNWNSYQPMIWNKYLNETSQYGYDFTKLNVRKEAIEKIPFDKLKRLYELAKKGMARGDNENEEFLQLVHLIYP
jgi:hypothetical protein